MIKKIGLVVIILVSIIALISFINGSHRTATFRACPNTDYCSDLGSVQQGDVVHIEYSGWPYKVKIGNPDWCTQGVCEGNNYHPDYQWEFLVYNVLIMSLPFIILVTVYSLYAHRGTTMRFTAVVFITIGICMLGWFTSYATRLYVIWGANSQIGSYDDYDIHAGIPFPEHLSMDFGCSSDQPGPTKVCVRESIRYETSIWHAPFIVYANAIFWTTVWGLLVFLGVKKYAHTRD